MFKRGTHVDWYDAGYSMWHEGFVWRYGDDVTEVRELLEPYAAHGIHVMFMGRRPAPGFFGMTTVKTAVLSVVIDAVSMLPAIRTSK